jgi:protein-tyrosine phosphatase
VDRKECSDNTVSDFTGTPVNSPLDSWSILVSKRYGRKMGLLRHYSHLARYQLGVFSPLKAVNWSSVRRLVFVCKGNICRSPYAEAKARKMDLTSSSFGLDASAGVPANPAAIKVALARGIDMSRHVARTADIVDLVSGDLLAAMESSQARVLQSVTLPAGVQVTLLGLWCIPPRPHMEDPFGLSDDYFDTCFALIDDALVGISTHMRKPDSVALAR